jgi:hypothetical protein
MQPIIFSRAKMAGKMRSESFPRLFRNNLNQQMMDDQKRDEGKISAIMESALKLFSERGFHGTSIA